MRTYFVLKFVDVLFAIRDMVDRVLVSMVGDTEIVSAITQKLVSRQPSDEALRMKESETLFSSGLCRKGLSLLSVGVDLKLASKLASQESPRLSMTTEMITDFHQRSPLKTGWASSLTRPEPSSLESTEQTITITSNGQDVTIMTRPDSHG